MTGRNRSTTDNDLVKVAYVSDKCEAELLQGLLRTADVSSVVRRAPGFDVPEFLAAGQRACPSPRPTSPSPERFCAMLTRVSPSHRRGPAETGRRACSLGCWSPWHSSGSSSASPPT
jgi:hypothetical protein